MAYRDSFAAAILVNGKVQRGDGSNTVILPFSTEYAIRLKNKHRRRAVADVTIDGRIAARGIVVNANSHLDLERFVASNLNEGARFKVVRRNDKRVDQPDDNECGNIEVRFYLEKEPPEVKVVEHHKYTTHRLHSCNAFGHCSICCSDWHCYICRPSHHRHFDTGPWLGSNIGLRSEDAYGGSVTSKGMSVGGTSSAAFSSAPVSMNTIACGNTVPPTTDWAGDSEDAATVEGSLSKQAFTSVHVDIDKSDPVVLMIRLRGAVKLIDDCACGNKRRDGDKHCGGCGAQLVYA